MSEKTPLPPNLPMPTLGGRQIWADVFVHRSWRIQQNVWTRHHRLLDPDDIRHAWGTYGQCLSAFDRLRHAEVPPREHLVLLLHGIFRTKDVFRPMASALRSAGFEAEAVNYPSTRQSLDEHAIQVNELLDHVTTWGSSGTRTVSLVGHSMGGIVARMVLAEPGAWRQRVQVGRLVTIGSPNRGAELVDRLRNMKSFEVVAGPAGQALATDALPTLPVPDCAFGCVAGARGDPRGWNPILHGDDDMTVTVDSALLDGAEDTLVVPEIHTFLVSRPEVIEGVVRFLGTGRFSPS